MKRGIAEDRVELPLEAEVMAIDHSNQQTSVFGGARLFDTRIGAKHAGSPNSNFFSQSAVAATQIHDEFARLRRKQF
jgi:hypothetical protein